MEGLPEVVECWKSVQPPRGYVSYTTFRAGERPVAGRVTEEVWLKWSPSCDLDMCFAFENVM